MTDPVTLVDDAIQHLRLARNKLRQAGARRATDKVRRAIASAEGARRHAELAPIREQRQQHDRERRHRSRQDRALTPPAQRDGIILLPLLPTT